MKFRYYIVPNLNLVLEYYSGSFEYKDIFECKKMEMNDPYWKDYYDVLSDIRNGKFVLTNSDIKNIHGYLDKYPEINAKRKSAILTNLPSHVVFGTLLKGHNDTELSLITPEIFSTLEAALLWLGIARNEKESIEKIFAELSLDS